jgi:hypothetical protein
MYKQDKINKNISIKEIGFQIGFQLAGFIEIEE